MATANPSPVYEDFVAFLADGLDISRLLAFRLSKAKQERLDRLLALNREGRLTGEEKAELEECARFEHVVRMVKARALSRGQ